jgi:hypothetical protein
VEKLKPNNETSTPTRYRTDYELLLERKVQRFRQAILDMAKMQLDIAEYERKKYVRINYFKWIISRNRIWVRKSLAKLLVIELQKVDQEVEKMK